MNVPAVLSALDERTIARVIGIPHDEARIRFHLNSNTVQSYQEFEDVIACYVQHHDNYCVSVGGHLPRTEALGRAKEMLEKEYHRHNGNIVSAFHDAQGLNGGMRKILDALAEAMKADSTERYIRNVLDQISPVSWPQRVDAVRQFLAQCGPYLAPSIDPQAPERYAQDINELIRSYVAGLRNTSAMFRRH